MPQFKDIHGQEWRVSLDAPKVRAVRAKCSIDPISGEAYERVYDDVLLCEVLAVLCHEEIQRIGISTDDFEARIVGDALDKARAAFHEAQLDFSPSSRKPMLLAAAAQMSKIRQEQTERDIAAVNAPEFHERMTKLLIKKQKQAMDDAFKALGEE